MTVVTRVQKDYIWRAVTDSPCSLTAVKLRETVVLPYPAEAVTTSATQASSPSARAVVDAIVELGA